MGGPSRAADAPGVVLKHIPPGWTAAEEGYFLNAEALSALSSAAKTYRLERDEWEKSYNELSEDALESQRALRAQLTELRRELDGERDSWRKEAARAKSPGLGVFAGAGYGGDGVEPVIGVGLVWKLW
jgi:hypothetical protein